MTPYAVAHNEGVAVGTVREVDVFTARLNHVGGLGGGCPSAPVPRASRTRLRAAVLGGVRTSPAGWGRATGRRRARVRTARVPDAHGLVDRRCGEVVRAGRVPCQLVDAVGVAFELERLATARLCAAPRARGGALGRQPTRARARTLGETERGTHVAFDVRIHARGVVVGARRQAAAIWAPRHCQRLCTRSERPPSHVHNACECVHTSMGRRA